MRYLVKSASKMGPLDPGDPLWVISSTLNSSVRLLKTFPNIKSYSEVQMKGFMTIQDDQMVGK